MNSKSIILMIIFAFTFIPLVLAEVARKRFAFTLEDFFLQSRKMSLTLTFFTVYATWFSSFAFLGSTSSFYAQGPLYMTCFAWNVLFALLFMVVGRRLWFYGKEHGYITATDFFADIYENRMLTATITGVLTVFTLPYLVIQMYGGALLIETATGGLIPWRTAGLLFFLIITIYLWAGGLRAVAMTDVFYGLLTFAALVLTGGVLLSQEGGIASVVSRIAETNEDFFVLGGEGSDNSVIVWLAMFVILPVGVFMGPPMWTRVYAVGSRKAFRRIPLLLAIMAGIYIGPLIAGLVAKDLYPDMAFLDNLLVLIVMEKMPVVLMAVILCGIAAAALSTANSQIHAIASVYTVDIHHRYIAPKIGDRQMLRVGKWAVAAIALLVYLLMMCSPKGLVNLGIVSFSGTAHIFIPAVGALTWKRSNGTAAVIGVWTGIIVNMVGAPVFHISIIGMALPALALNLLVFVGLSLLLPEDRRVRDRIVEYRESFAKNDNDMY